MSSSAPSPPPHRRSLFHWLPIVVWVGVMLYFTSVPDPTRMLLPGAPTTATDLGGHAFGFFVLMLLLTRSARLMRGSQGMRPVMWAAALCAVYGVFDELHQIPIPGRAFEWVDLLADGTGMTLGGIVATVFGARRTARTATDEAGRDARRR